MKELTSKQQKEVKKAFMQFKYLAGNIATDSDRQIKDALRWFKQGREATPRELELIAMNFLHHYETNLRQGSAQQLLAYDAGLIAIAKLYEGIAGLTAFEFFRRDLSYMRDIYQDWTGQIRHGEYQAVTA